MVRRARCLILAAALLGCHKPVTAPPVIVRECPAPPPLPRPALDLFTLPPDATPGQAAQSCVSSLAACVSYANQCAAILDGYRPAPAAPGH